MCLSMYLYLYVCSCISKLYLLCDCAYLNYICCVIVQLNRRLTEPEKEKIKSFLKATRPNTDCVTMRDIAPASALSQATMKIMRWVRVRVVGGGGGEGEGGEGGGGGGLG